MKLVRVILAVFVGAALSPSGDAWEVEPMKSREWSPSDHYVNFGARLLAIAAAGRHLERDSGKFAYQGDLGFEQELAVERVKIKFSRQLRSSFRLRYPELAEESKLAPEEEDRLLPYFVSPDVARRLSDEGFDVPLSSAWANQHITEAYDPRGRSLLMEMQSPNENGRNLFEFPIDCVDGGDCATDFTCWGLSLAIDGLNMEQTCNLIEKVQGIGGGTWTIDDWLREIPSFMDNLRDLDSIAGIFSMRSCGVSADVLSQYSIYGQDAVFYYPKAMCQKRDDMGSCLMEIAVVLQIALTEPIKGMLDSSITDIVKQIRNLMIQAHLDMPTLCTRLDAIGVLQEGNILKFLGSWEDLFETTVKPNGVGTVLKLELLLQVLDTMTRWDFVKDYLPGIPKGCTRTLSVAGKEIYQSLFKDGGSGSVDDTVKSICGTLGPSSVRSCMTGVMNNIDSIEWMASTLGNGNLHQLTEVVLPSLCEAMTDVDGLTMSDLFQQIPMLLRVYVALDLDVLGGVIHGLHDAVVDCGEEFAILIEDIEQTLDNPKGMVKVICGNQVSENECLGKVSDGLDQIDFVRNVIGIGTLRTVIMHTIPGACTITRKIIDVESDTDSVEIDINTILSLLPDIIDWYVEFSSIEALSSYAPQWPTKSCPDSVVEDMSEQLRLGFQDMAQLPNRICHLTTPGPKTCLLAFGDSFEKSDLTKSMFKSTVSEAGASQTFHVLLDSILPSLCAAVSETSIDVNDLIAAIPVLLESYRILDIKPLQNLFPKVHKLLMDYRCSRQFSKFAGWINDEVLTGKDPDVVGHICSRVGHNQCLKQLSDGIDQIGFITDQVGKGALSLLVENAIPAVCLAMTNVVDKKSFDVDKIIENLPDLLLLVDRLLGVSNADGSAYPLARYVPDIPRDETCRKGFRDMAEDVKEFIYGKDSSFSKFMDEICHEWKGQGLYECMHGLGESLDKIDMIQELIGKETVQDLVDHLIPATCEIIAPAMPVVDFNVSGLIESLPEIINWYAQIQGKVPSAFQGYLPKFPKQECSADVIAKFQEHMKYATETPGVDVARILKVTCSMLTTEEYGCLQAIGRAVDNSPLLADAIGLKENAMEFMLGESLERACTIIGDEFDHLHFSNIVLKIPEVLRFVTSMRESLPSFLASYLPIIPHEECDASYESISQKFAEGLTKGSDRIPAVLCGLTDTESGCIIKMGDAIDGVEYIRDDLLGGGGLIQYAIETILTEACSAFDSLSKMELSKIAQQVPTALKIVEKLNSYQILDSLIPDVPQSCSGAIEPITNGLAGVLETSSDFASEVPKYLCKNIDDDAKQCLSDFGYSLEQVEWISNIVPDAHSITIDLLKLLPLVCGLLFDTESEAAKELTSPDRIIEYLPITMSLFENLRNVSFVQPLVPPVSDQCMQEFKTLATDLANDGIYGAPEVICAMNERTKTCFINIGAAMYQMDQYKSIMPNDHIVKDVIDTLPTACKAFKELGDFSYRNIIGSIPTLLDLVHELNDIDVFDQYIPDISDTCDQQYRTSLVPRFMNTSVANAACGITKEEESCIKQLVEELLSVTLISELASSNIITEDGGSSANQVIMAMIEEIFQMKPEACALLHTLETEITVGALTTNLYGLLPKVLDLLDSIRNIKILNQYIPHISDPCKQEYVDVVGALRGIENPLLLPHAICGITSGNDQLNTCLIDLATEIDTLAFNLETKPLAKVTVFVLPDVCGVIDQVIDKETGDIIFANVFDAIPVVARIYDALQTKMPVTLQAWFPAFPSNTCNDDVLASLTSLIKQALDASNGTSDIPTLLCSGLGQNEKSCLSDLGDAMDQVPMVRDMLGRPGIIQELIGEPMDAVCSILGQPTENESISMTSLLAHFDLALHLMDMAHKFAPDFAKEFLPQVPKGECTAAYAHISLTLTNFTLGKLCLLEKNTDIECLAKLGDNIEETPALVRLLYKVNDINAIDESKKPEESLLRILAHAIPDTVCASLDEFGSLDFHNILDQFPQIVDLLEKLRAYPLLEGFVPAIPSICKRTLNPLLQRLKTETATAVACSLSDDTKTCALELGTSIENTELGATFLPDARGIVKSSFDLLPVICTFVNSDGTEDPVDVASMLKYFPTLVDLYDKLDEVAVAVNLYKGVGATCKTRLRAMSLRIAEVNSMDLLPETLCKANSYEDWECIAEVGNNVEQLPMLAGYIPPGLVAQVVALIRDHVCDILYSAGEINYAGFARAIPSLMDLLTTLESMEVLRDYLPHISSKCKAVFSDSIAEKLESGISKSQQFGLVHITTNLDFSGLTGLLCEFTSEEIQCFEHAADAIVDVPMIASLITLPSKPNGEAYSLDTMVEAAFDVRADACVLLGELTDNIDFNSIFIAVRQVIRIMDKLNEFPVIEAYVPNFGSKCVSAFDNITSYVTEGPNPVANICGISQDEKLCLVHIGKELDKVPEVQMAFTLFKSKEYPTIEETIEVLVNEVMVNACALFSQIATEVDGTNIALLIKRIPKFLMAMQTLTEMPFMDILAPQISGKCATQFQTLDSQLEKVSNERESVQTVCYLSKTYPLLKSCIQELNDAFEEVEFIGEHIPDGLVKAFLDSFDSGCKLFTERQDTFNRTAFMAKDLPILVQNVGFIANVDETCISSMVSHISTDICAVQDTCTQSYFYSVSALPLVGQFVPAWVTDVVIGICAVKSGDQSIESFIEKSFPTVLDEVAIMQGNENCKSNMQEVAESIRNGAKNLIQPQQVCTKMTNQCIKQFVDSLENVGFTKGFIPEGLDELLLAACEYFNGGDITIYGLLPHFTTIFHVLELVLGYPNDACNVQLESVTGALAVSQSFDAALFCNNLDSHCVTEIVFSLQKLPFIGNYLPAGTDQLVGASCAVIKDKNQFSSLTEHISTLFDIIGRLVAGSHMHLDQGCQTMVREQLFDRAGNFKGLKLCEIEDSCSNQLTGAMQQLPVVGEFVPDSLVKLLVDMCEIHDTVGKDGQLVVTDDASDPDGLPQLLPRLLVLLGKILTDGDDDTGARVLDQHQLECGNKLIEYGKAASVIDIASFCGNISTSCLPILSEKLSTIPLIGKMLPDRTGELMATACDVMSATNDREILLRRFPSLLSVVGNILDINDKECQASLVHLGTVYKSKDGNINDGKILCQGLPNTDCLNKVAKGAQRLPFIGPKIPDTVVELVEETCDLINENITFAQYITSEGPVLLRLAGLIAGVDQKCVDQFKRIDELTTEKLCSLVDPDCVEQLGVGLRSIPLIGAEIPDGLDTIFNGLCEFAKDPIHYWPQFANESLPSILQIVGKAATGSELCGQYLKEFGERTAQTQFIDVKSLCMIQPQRCFTQLVDGLTDLPLWGPFLPPQTKELITEVCTLEIDVNGNQFKDSDLQKFIKLVDDKFPVIMQFVVNLVHLQGDCGTKIQGIIDKSNTTEKSNPVEMVCMDMTSQCRKELIHGYRDLPLVGQLVPQDFDDLVDFVCPFALTLHDAQEDKVIPEIFKRGGLLDQMIRFLPSLNSFTVGSQSCQEKIEYAMQVQKANQYPWDHLLPCYVGEDCLKPMFGKLFHYPMISHLVKNFGGSEKLESIIVDQPCIPLSGTNNGNNNNNNNNENNQLSTPVIGVIVLVVISALTAMAVFGRAKYAKRKQRKQKEVLNINDSRAIIPSLGVQPDLDLYRNNGGTSSDDDEEDDDSSDDNWVSEGKLSPILN